MELVITRYNLHARLGVIHNNFTAIVGGSNTISDYITPVLASLFTTGL